MRFIFKKLPLFLFVIHIYVFSSETDLNSLEFVENDYDKLCLKSFFSYLITNTQSGYSLYGNKPIAMTFFHTSALSEWSDIQKYPYNNHFQTDSFLLAEGWRVFEKYKNDFKGKKFYLRVNKQTKRLFLINKRASLKVITKNLDIFHQFLRSSKSPQAILDLICTPSNEMELLDSTETILGILLGFGRNNSIAYEKRMMIAYELLKDKNSPPPLIPKFWDLLSSNDKKFLQVITSPDEKKCLIKLQKFEYDNLVQSWAALNRKLDFFITKTGSSELNLLLPLGFIINKDPSNQKENDELRIHYQETEKRIYDLAKDFHPHEIFLKKWMSNS